MTSIRVFEEADVTVLVVSLKNKPYGICPAGDTVFDVSLLSKPCDICPCNRGSGRYSRCYSFSKVNLMTSSHVIEEADVTVLVVSLMCKPM